MKRFLAAILLALSFVTISLAQDSANLFRPTVTPPNPPCPYSRLFMNTSNQMALVSCTGVVTTIGSGGGGGSGTVTSVGLSLPSIFSVSGSPVTTSGTLTAALATQTANLVFAGPTSGGAATPTFRALVSADIPSLDAAKITSGTIATARLGSGTANSTTFLRGDQTWAIPSLTVTGVPDAINAVRDYGCVGDDVANDTTCLTNALLAAKASLGKALYLRAGTYKTTAKLEVPGGVTLYGDGREKTIIHGTANDTILELKAGTGTFLSEGPTVKSLSVYGSSAGASQIGISVDDAVGPDFYINGAWIENVSVYQTGSHGVYFGRAFSSTFKRIYASAPVSGYPFLFNQFNMPGNTYEGLYAQDVNVTNPAGFRVRTGDIHCWGCNGINNSSSNSWWAIIGDKIGVDGATGNASAYFNCWGCNIESSKAGGIWHYSDSTSYLDGRTLFAGDSSGSGTYVALKYEVTTPGSGGLPAAQPKGNLGPLVVFANSPLSFYANSEVIHANDLPPVTIEGDVRQADGAIISSYRNTTNSRSEKIFRLDARMPVTTITANASYTQPGATNYEANCALGCTLTLPFAGYWASMEQLIYIRNIGVGTLVVNGNSGSTMNGGGSYSLAAGESVAFIPHSASADYRLVGVGGSGVANRITYWNDVQRVTSSANLTYDGTTVLNQRAGGNPYFAANDTTNGITTRFGPLAGGPDRAFIGTTSNHPFGLYANNAERWTIGTTGHLTPGVATTYNIGSTSLPINDVTIGGKLYWTGSTVFDFSGSGSPEGVITAGIGSVYRRTNGSTGTTFYIKESGVGNTGWSALGGAGAGGITTLNGLTTATQSFAVGTSGTDFAVSSATSTHTFNLPDAGASARGVVTTGTQTIAGAKTVTSVFTANPGTTPTTGILVDINSLGSAGTRDSNWQVFRGRSNDGTAHLTEWKLFGDVTSNAGASNFSLQTRIDAASFAEVFTVSDTGLVSAGDFSGDTFTAGVGFVGDGAGLTNLDASQLITGIVPATRGGAGTISGILKANGSGTVSAVTVGAGLAFDGTTLSASAANPTGTVGLTAVNGSATTYLRSDGAPALSQGISPTWTGSHVFTTTTVAREFDPQTDNTYDLGTTALRWKTLHVGPGSVVIHNDATNTLKATLGFSGSTAQLVTDSATPLQIKTGSNTGVFFNTNGTIGVNLATTTSGNVDFRQLANGDTVFNARRATDTSPTGNFLNFQNAAGTALMTVDITGSMTAGTVPTARLSGAVSASNMPALTGDVTTTAGTVATTIANDAVTFAKFQNITDARLLGRSAGSSGDMQEITIGSGLSLSSGVLATSGGGITSLGGQTGGSQTFSRVNDTNVTLTITSATNNHDFTLGWTGTLAAGRLNSNVVQAVTNDTNVTGSITAQNLTLGFTGTLAAGRLNSNVVQAITNDTNVTGSITAQNLTLGFTGTLAKARQNSATVYNDANNTYSGGNQDFTSAFALTVPTGFLGETASGRLFYNTISSNLGYGDAGTSRFFANLDEAQTFTNKTLSASSNTIGGVTMTLGSDNTGDIYYRNSGGVLTRLGVGSNGQVLTLAAGLPSWAAPSGGGSGTVTHTAGALTANSFVFGNGTDDIKATAAATNGQLLIGSTGANPVAASLTGSAAITVTNGAGSITLSVPNTSITNAMLAGSISNANLANSTITIQGSAIALGGSTLATTATPQFAGMGLGTTAPATGLTTTGHAAFGQGAQSTTTVVDLADTYTTTAGGFGLNSYLALNQGANNGNSQIAVQGQVESVNSFNYTSVNGGLIGVRGSALKSGSGAVTLMMGIDGSGDVAASGTVTSVAGVRGSVNVTSTGTVTDVRTIEAGAGSQTNAGSTITNWSQVYIRNAVKAAGTRTNQYGLFIEAQSGGATINRSLHSAGSAYFATTVDVVGAFTGSTVNATTGYTVNGVATSGEFLRGNGTNIVLSAIQATDLPGVVVRTNQSNTYSTGSQDFTSASSFTLPVSAGANPVNNGTIAYDTTAGALEYGTGGTNRTVANLDQAQTFTNKTFSASTNVLGGVTVTMGSDATGDGYARNSSGVLARVPTYNVRSFGAVCDGTTNDATAIQNAINAAVTGGTISFQGCKTTKVNTQLTVGNGSGTYSTGAGTTSTINDVTIEGNGVKITWGGSSTGVFSVNGPVSRVKIRDVFVDMTGASGIAFDLNHPRMSEFSNIYIENNADYGVRLRAYGNATLGDGATSNIFDNVVIASTTAGAKGFDIGYTAICTGCTLDPAQTVFRNIRARFDTGPGTYVSGSIGINLNYVDATQFDNAITAAATGLQITVPSGTGGSSYPAGIQFNNPALVGTSSVTVSGTWTATDKIGFYNYQVADGQTVPTDTANTYGFDSDGNSWGQGNIGIVGTGKRITADFSNATDTNRTMFQSSTASGATYVGAIPASGGAFAGFQAYASSTTTNTSYIRMFMNGTFNSVIDAGKTGSGTVAALGFWQGGTQVATFGGTTNHFAVGGTSTPDAAFLTVAGGIATAVTSLSANTTLTDVHSTILCDASGAARTMTLPASSGLTGRVYTLKKTDSSANACIFDGNSTETIDGNLTASIIAQNGTLTIQSDGTNWRVIGSSRELTGEINGLVVSWASSSTVSVSPGRAQMQNTGAILTNASTLTSSAVTRTTTLNGGLTNSQTNIVVADGSWMPTANITILVDSEQMSCTRSGNTLTCTRGFNGTANVVHSNGATVGAQFIYYVYVYDNSGTAAIEVSTTAPASSAWFGTARSKTSDTSRRYVGFAPLAFDGNLANFQSEGRQELLIIRYQNDTGNQNRMLTNVSPTTNTVKSLATVMPVGARSFEATIYNLASAGICYFDTSESGTSGTGLNPAGGVGLYAQNPAVTSTTWLPVNASQEFRYSYLGTPTGGAIYLDLLTVRAGR